MKRLEINDRSVASPCRYGDLFTASLAETDPEIADVVQRELGRQRDEIELIASENIVSKACWRRRARFSPTNMPKACPGGAITAAANTSMWPKTLRLNGLPSFSDVSSQTCSRIPALPPMPPRSWR